MQARRGVRHQLEAARGGLHQHRDDRQAEAAAVDVLRVGRPPEPIHRQLALLLGEARARSEEHTSELQSLTNLVCRLLLEKKKRTNNTSTKAQTSEVRPASIRLQRPLHHTTVT